MDNIYTIYKNEFPNLLKEINDPPEKLNIIGKLVDENAENFDNDNKEEQKTLCIVGARQHSKYGEEVCKKLINGLKRRNICIVSGMAIGIDSIVHRTAMENGLNTIAFPGSGLNKNVLYPFQNRKLADEIVYSGGALISEFENDQTGALWTFPKRNRLMAGISHAVLVVEAELISGTLITSKLAVDYNRDVGAVPGQIFSKLSEGPNMLISKGAKIIRNSNDILEMLDMKIEEKSEGNVNIENKQLNLLGNIRLNGIKLDNLENNTKQIIDLLKIEPLTNEELIIKSKFSARELNNIISILEINELIEERNGNYKIK